MENISAKISIPDRDTAGGMAMDWEDNDGPIPLGKLSPVANLNSEVIRSVYGRALCNQWNPQLAQLWILVWMM